MPSLQRVTSTVCQHNKVHRSDLRRYAVWAPDVSRMQEGPRNPTTTYPWCPAQPSDSSNNGPLERYATNDAQHGTSWCSSRRRPWQVPPTGVATKLKTRFDGLVDLPRVPGQEQPGSLRRTLHEMRPPEMLVLPALDSLVWRALSTRQDHSKVGESSSGAGTGTYGGGGCRG
jgi:hypothetical protein